MRRANKLTNLTKLLDGEKKHFIIIFLSFLVLFLLNVHAQVEYSTGAIKIKDGLSQSSVLSLLQDDKGFIWAGTKDGLDRFDGYIFKHFKYNQKDKHSLSNNGIRCLYKDSHGFLWIGTYRGLNKYDPLTEKFVSYSTASSGSVSLNENVVTAILEDHQKNIWVGTKNGLNKLNADHNKIFNSDNGNKIFKLFDGKEITSLFEDSENNIWVGTIFDGLFCISPNRYEVIHCQAETNRHAKKDLNYIRVMKEYSKNKIFIATFGQGLWIYDKSAKTFEPFVKKYNYPNLHLGKYICDLKFDLNDNLYVLTLNGLFRFDLNGGFNKIWEKNVPSPTAFIIDRSGIIWIGTDGSGIVKLVPDRKKFRTVSVKNEGGRGFNISSVRAIYIDGKGDLLVGGYTGLCRLGGYYDGAKHWEKIDQLDKYNVYKIAEDPVNKSILWIGTEGEGLLKFNTLTKKFLKYSNSTKDPEYFFLGDELYDILIDKNKDIYFATNYGTAKYVSKKNSFINYIYDPRNVNTINKGKVKSLCKDSLGRIWMGTERSGISILDPLSNSFERYQFDINDHHSLSDNKVNIIFRDSKNNIWVGTANGLDRYVPSSHNFVIYTTENGLPNNYIYGILEDSKGILWLSTNKGLSRFDPSKDTFINYDESYGLQSNEFNTAAYFKSSKGEMFFGGINGYTSFYPSDIVTNTFAPAVVITDLKIFNSNVQPGRSVSYSKEIILSHNDFLFSFDFALPEYTNPNRNKFEYKLIGFYDEWINIPQGQRTAVFTGISPGKYTLVARGANNDGIWGKETSLKIIITPPYWQTWEFRLSAGLFLTGIVVLIFKRKINKLKNEKNRQIEFSKKLIESQESERKRIAGELHDSIGQDLLIAKNKLMLKSVANDGKNMEDVSQLLSHSIDDISRLSHNLRPLELDELGLTMAIEAMIERVAIASGINFKFEMNNIDHLVKTDDQINVFRVIQEAVNNVIKHSNAKEAVIRNECTDRFLILEVSDNGIGIIDPELKNAHRPHFGLSGMKERVKLLNGKLSISSKKNNGTKIKLVIPIMNVRTNIDDFKG